MTTLASRPAVLSPALASEKLMTAEEFYALPDTESCELINGHIVPKYEANGMSGPGGIHGKIVLRIGGRMEVFVTSANLGDAYTETGFIVSRNPHVVRRPDVAFVAAARLTEGTPEGFFTGTPDLVVEVLSPNDRWTDVEDKARIYFENDTVLLWIVDPQARILTARTPDGMSRIYGEHDEVPGDPVLPGFVLRLREIWP